LYFHFALSICNADPALKTAKILQRVADVLVLLSAESSLSIVYGPKTGVLKTGGKFFLIWCSEKLFYSNT